MNVLVYFELSLGKKKAEDKIVKIVYCERAQVVWVKAVKSALSNNWAFKNKSFW